MLKKYLEFYQKPYKILLKISWKEFLLLIGVVYVLVNFIFAMAYLAGGNCIANAHPGSLKDTFFFSVQTMSTVGYGFMYPTTTYANLVITVEVIITLLGFAVMTGLAFARFSLPSADIIFSKVAVIDIHNGVPTLIFRIANKQLTNRIFEAQVRADVLLDEQTNEGNFMRRFYDLNLIRNRTPVFGWTWTLMHRIDENSPFHGHTSDSILSRFRYIVVTLTGVDEMVSQSVYTQYTYNSHDIIWNSSFVDILTVDDRGEVSINLDNFHNYELHK